MKYGIYILIILCGILPLLFRRTSWARMASLLVLGGLIVFYMMGLLTSARLASSIEYQETKEAPSMEWMDGAKNTAMVVVGYQPIGILLFAALMILAASPVKEKQPANQEVEPTRKTPVE